MRNEALGLGFDALHVALLKLCTMVACLLAQPGQQRIAGYARREAGVVV